MSMQQALGVVGGIVGAFFGYPQLGFVVGSLIGAALTPKQKSEGPRLDDLKVTVSTYGGGIPTAYGAVRVGGNVIWSTDKIEIPTTTETGKGGGTETTQYVYVVHMGIALCMTPTDGSEVLIRKIWRDGKLVYDASTGASIRSALASADSPYSFIEVYQGGPAQMPDGIEELYEGAGNVPAYRGIMRARLNAVDCPGGRVPQFSFEICVGGTQAVAEDLIIDGPGGTDHYGSSITHDGIWHLVNIPGAEPVVDVYFASTDGVILQRRIVMPFSGAGNYYLARPIPGQAIGMFFVDDGSDTSIYQIAFDTGEITPIANATGPVANYAGHQGGTAYDEATETYAWLCTTTAPYDNKLYMAAGGVVIECDALTGTGGPVAAYGGLIYAIEDIAGVLRLVYRDGVTGDATGTPVAGPTLAATMRDSALLVNADGVFAMISASPAMRLYRIEPTGWELIRTTTIGTGAAHVITSPTFWTEGGPAVVPRVNFHEYYLVHDTITTAEALVSDIISEQCLKAGLTAGQFDVTGIPDTDTVWGYVLTNPASARNNIQPLMTAYAIDATEEDGKVKFFKRVDITSVATIPYGELGCVEGDGEPGDPMPLSRAQEAELPRSVTVSGIGPDFDYQTISEPASRQVTESKNDQNFELPIATTPDHLVSVANMILYDAWNDRNKRSFKVSRKYAFVSAGDGVTFTFADGTLQMWRITNVTDTGVLCEWEGVPADASIYAQTDIGGAEYSGQEVAGLAPPTRVVTLDTPIMRDADNNAGLYVRLAGMGTGWPGGELYVGDSEASLEPAGTVAYESPLGVAETVLGDWDLNIVDESNLVTVNVGYHELATITRAVLLTGTSNVAAIGAAGRWEIIKFQRADDLGDGRYILSGLMRGQRGTEWAAGLHEAGDTFAVMAVAGMLRPNLDAGSIGQTKTYKGITLGRPFSSGSIVEYANTAEGLECFSPTNLRKDFDGDDILLDWVRRTRLSENWLLGIVPLGEASERWEIDIYEDDTFAVVKRTISTTTAAATYTSAQQIVDFGSNQTEISVRIYQISDVVARGHELEETL